MSFYQIHFEPSQVTYNAVTKLLERNPASCEEANPSIWLYEVIEREEDEWFDFINQFLDILEPNFASLEKIGIPKENISFWFIYEYDGQCNMEFDSARLKRLGNSGVGLCISCYDMHDYSKD